MSKPISPMKLTRLHVKLTAKCIYANRILFFAGIPTDEEQAAGLERRILQSLKKGKVRFNTLAGTAVLVDIV